MLILKDFQRLSGFRDIVLTIGNFDGVHLGHQKILKRLRERALERNGTSAVLTFEPHPIKVLRPHQDLRVITPFEDRVSLIETLGIDLLLCLTFDKALAEMEADEFIRDIIVERINAIDVIVGSDYRFGRERQGSIELLKRRGRKYGFSVTVIRKKIVSDRVVSSNWIRSLISHGKVDEARHLLGRPYTIRGRVIKGKGRGARLLQIPTANIETTYELIPGRGVYAVRVIINEKVYGGVMNIGKNPTFGEGTMSLEVHILDFSGNLLGGQIDVQFLKRLRGERMFYSIDDLKRAIQEDIDCARRILAKTPKI